MKFGNQGHYLHIWAAFELVVFKVILGSFGALFSKWPVIRTHVLGTFDLIRFKVILGSFGAFFSKWYVTQQPLAGLRAKWMKFLDS